MAHGAAWHGGGGFVPESEVHEPSGSFRGRAPSGSFHCGSGGGGGFLAPSAGCEACGAPAYSSAWHAAFNVMLCDACHRDAKLISKGAAKEAYLLSDGDLSKLGTLSRTNPQHKAWKAMQLYLQSQVEEVAERKHGSVEELEEKRHARRTAKVKSRLRKRANDPDGDGDGDGSGAGDGGDGQESGAAGQGAPRETAAQRRIRSRLEEEYARAGRGAPAAGGSGGAAAGAQPPLGGDSAGDGVEVETI